MGTTNASISLTGVLKKKKTPTVVLQEITLFKEIDVDQLSRDLHITEEAQKAGKLNLPHPDETNRFSTYEQTIDSAVKNILDEYHQTAIDRIESISVRMRDDSQRTKRDIEQASNIVESLRAQLKDSLYTRKKELYEIAENCNSSYSQLKEFKEKNKLTRPAAEKTRLSFIFSGVLLLLCIVVEGIFNASFFSTNLEGGLVQGFLFAAFSSAANVIGMFVVGCLFVRYINHVKWKFIGWIGLGVACFWTIFIGLLIAHYRDALQVSADAARDAVIAFVSNPFSLSDINSWFLFFLTLIAGMIAGYDGYRFDDVYPGYGKVSRNYNSALQDWLEAIDECKDDFADLCNEFKDKLAELVGSAANGVNSYATAYYEKYNVYEQYKNAQSSATKAHQSLIASFRHENQKTRTTESPRYFQQLVKLDLPELPSVLSDSKEEDMRVKDKLRELANNLVNKESSLKNGIDNEYLNCISELEQMVPTHA